MKRFCDPEECDYCQYIGDGTFICDKYNPVLIVMDEWDVTEDFLACNKR